MRLREPRESTIVVLFTRDLRLNDHPALAEAVKLAERVVPLFVLDTSLLASDFASPNRVAFLLQSLTDLDASLRALGGALVVRRGDAVRETAALARTVGARAVFASADVSAYAHERQRRLREACAEDGIELRLFTGVTIVGPGELRPTGGDHFRVFTPYWNRWRVLSLRSTAPRPRRIALPRGLARGPFGRLSPVEVARRTADRPGGEAFIRQLCWRDFHHQVTAAFPAIARREYRLCLGKKKNALCLRIGFMSPTIYDPSAREVSRARATLRRGRGSRSDRAPAGRR